MAFHCARGLSSTRFGFVVGVAIAAFAGACSSDGANGSSQTGGSGGEAGSTTEGGSGGNAVGGSSGASGASSGAGGESGSAGLGGTSGASGSGGESGSVSTAGGGSGGAAGTAGEGGASGSGGSAGAGGQSNVVPTCLTNAVDEGVNRAANNYIECDVEAQAIDFDVAADYDANRTPGYDPAQTPVSFTDYGTAFTGYEVQQCHPYCYKANLTLGLDLIAGSDTSLRGEVLFDFPPTVMPIANAAGRNSLGWIYLDGPALPAGTTLTAQMVLKSADKGILLANDTKNVTPGNWNEFRYFSINAGFSPADLTNITSIGFRVTLSPTAGATDWHGVIYADHFQLRQ